MSSENVGHTNNDCKAEANLYGILLAGGRPRKLTDPDRPMGEPDGVDLYAKFIDGMSLFELNLRRVKKVLSPKRLFVLAGRKHLERDHVRAQLNERAQHSLVWQPQCSDTLPCLYLALSRIHERRPDAIVTIFPVDHFVAPEGIFLNHLRLAWRALSSGGECAEIVLLGMEPHSADLEYYYVVPESGSETPCFTSLARIALVGQPPNAAAAQRLIERGALWHSGIIVARCAALIDVIKRVLPPLQDEYPDIAAMSENSEPSKEFAILCRSLPALSCADILRSLPWEYRRALRVLPMRGVYWSELSNHRRQVECLEKMTGTTLVSHGAGVVA